MFSLIDTKGKQIQKKTINSQYLQGDPEDVNNVLMYLLSKNLKKSACGKMEK